MNVPSPKIWNITMTVAEIRQHFLDFFAEKAHQIVASAPIVIKNDPSLMFTNAGMNQFKDLFLGNKTATNLRVADTQKCLRVSGKHNDLEEVGRDTYHHTMFEMLGNWSFGDYFKTEAIAWAWELLTDVYKLPKDRLYVTVFEGDEKDNLPLDSEAHIEWKKWIAEDRIIKANKKDNFWEMGDSGPCGPCSEIHFDSRSNADRQLVDGKTLVNKDHPQVIEIWNLVFMQYNRKANGSLEPLPAKHVDTGMGLERLAVVIQGKQSNYDTDVFAYLLSFLIKEFACEYGKNEEKDIAMRVIADHIRAITFTIADGQLPANTGAGYVIRRILRRALRYAYRYLNAKEPFLYKMSQLVASEFKEVFPEAYLQKDFIAKVVEEEELSFLRTLSTGSRLFEKYVLENEGKVLSGNFAFELYDTYGFPIDLTELMANEAGLSINLAEFELALKEQKNRSKKDAATAQGDWISVAENPNQTIEFVGYDMCNCTSKILKYRTIEVKGKKQYQLVCSPTPFYAEGGGQVGDTGWFIFGGEKIPVFDTKRENEVIMHYTNQLPTNIDAPFTAQINEEKRIATERNHSVTHLIHAALRQVLGKHVVQKGSLVAPDYMRFDFSHFSKISQEELEQIEAIVNEKIRANIPLDEQRNISRALALEKGAMALFGEKYGDEVRMITFDPNYSIELCGGTHVKATGQIGVCKITSESAVAAGVRRLEVITGSAADAYISKEMKQLQEIKELLKTKDVVKALVQLQEENKALQQKISDFNNARTVALKNELLSFLEPVGQYKLLVKQIELNDANQGKNLSFMLKEVAPDLIAVLGSAIDGKAYIWVYVNDEIVQSTSLDARNVIKQISPIIKGGGGGQAFLANAGGKNVEGIANALALAKKEILDILQAV